MQAASCAKWTFSFQTPDIYIYFPYKFRDNLPLQVSFTEQSLEIKSVLSCILKKKEEIGSLVRGGRRGDRGRREVQKEGKRHRFPESSLCFPLPHPCISPPMFSYLLETKPSSSSDTSSFLLPGLILEVTTASLRTRTP